MGRPGRAPLVACTAPPMFPDLHDDWPIQRAAMAEAGLEGRAVVWSDPDVDWSAFDLVVANGVWDYIHQIAEFLRWSHRVGRTLGVPMVNSPDTLRWNFDKVYLRNLQMRGVSIVPTIWVAPGRDLDADPWSELVAPDAEVVVKPSISGGGHLTARYRRDEADAMREHIASLGTKERTAMVQPYVSAVDRDGETGLVLLDGEFSHAIHKAPMIRPGAGPQDNLIENQIVTAATASPEQLALGHQAVAVAEEMFGPITYARVDMVTLDDGTPALLELELLDPVLFFVTHPPAATTFARVLRRRLDEAAR